MEYQVFWLELEKGNLEYGLDDIALVDKPAIQSLFVAFSDASKFKFEIQNAEQRIVTGPVMIPDKLIYRELDGKPFYVAAKRETIFSAAQQWGFEGRNRNIKLTHDAKDNTPDVFMFESFVTDENRISSVKGYEDLPMGTWFITCKILSDEVWNQVKAGEFKGFSLEALFKLTPIKTSSGNDTLTDQELESLMNVFE